MTRIDLSGRVGIVTGAGRGLGRSYALLLAERGAAVVVNDVDDAEVDAVVGEIEALGGRAVRATDSVATPEGGAGIVEAALAAFGQVDLLVHNAGIVFPERFADQPIEQVRQTLNVHLLGAWHVGQPAWRNMIARGYGRVVLTSSMAQFGHFRQTAYGAAKAGLIGLAKSLAHDAEDQGLDIKVNAICPLAGTRLALPAAKEAWGDLMAPANVAAVVGYLLSSECPVNGQIIHAGGSHVARGILGQTPGWYSGKPGLTPEDVRDHWAEAMAMAPTDLILPSNAADQMQIVERTVLGHVVPPTAVHPLEQVK
jgi:NAD(P)-dependent dehydrogenase (short-subunit alcohol dehydrogenase family)